MQIEINTTKKGTIPFIELILDDEELYSILDGNKIIRQDSFDKRLIKEGLPKLTKRSIDEKGFSILVSKYGQKTVKKPRAKNRNNKL